jgi:hypothetical protein
MVFQQALESGQINPSILGFKAGEHPSQAEMMAKWSGASRAQRRGWSSALIGNYMGKLQEQQASTRERIQHANVMGAQAQTLQGGGAGGGPVYQQAVLDDQGRPRTDIAVVHPGKGGRVVKLPGMESPTVVEEDENGVPYYRGANNQKIPLSTDQYTVWQMAKKARVGKGGQSPYNPKAETQGTPAATSGAAAPAGKVKVFTPDGQGPYYIPAEQWEAANRVGYTRA